MKNDFDVIVIGAGGAGLAAAVSAAGQGARVLVCDAGRKSGGTTALSTGVVYAAGTALQRSRGIDDTADAMFEYIMTLNAYRAKPSLIRTLCDSSAGAVDWLTSLGVNFRPEDLYVSGVESVARGHRAQGNGAEIIEVLDRAAYNLQVTMALSTRVQSLLKAPDGRVTGIQVDGQTFTAGATVIATGGYGANRQLVERYYPGATDEYWYPGSPHAQGDGLALGTEAGAELGGPDEGWAGHSPGLVRELDSYLPGWVVFVNRAGRRFVRETAAYAVMPNVFQAQPGNEAFVIF